MAQKKKKKKEKNAQQKTCSCQAKPKHFLAGGKLANTAAQHITGQAKILNPANYNTDICEAVFDLRAQGHELSPLLLISLPTPVVAA